MKTIGITTTIPLEIPLAAGWKVVDLNNLFVTHQDPASLIARAERDGFPKSLCAWIKGIYGVCMTMDIRHVVGVVEGDCSNTRALLEVLKLHGVTVIPFGFPHSRTKEAVGAALESFCHSFGITMEAAAQMQTQLLPVRRWAAEIDRLTWEEHKATGWENHLYQVMMSDMDGDPQAMETLLHRQADIIRTRPEKKSTLRLAYMGVPPVFSDLHTCVESCDARVVYHEVQRAFAFPESVHGQTLTEQYRSFTYPYDLDGRLEEIEKQLEVRRVDAVIHYTQSFCYRALDDLVVRKRLRVPVLTLEGDRDTHLDMRSKLRLEAFLDMLKARKEAGL